MWTGHWLNHSDVHSVTESGKENNTGYYYCSCFVCIKHCSPLICGLSNGVIEVTTILLYILSFSN